MPPETEDTHTPAPQPVTPVHSFSLWAWLTVVWKFLTRSITAFLWWMAVLILILEASKYAHAHPDLFAFLHKSSTAPTEISQTLNDDTHSPIDCHGDSQNAYFRTDKVNLAYFQYRNSMYYCDIRQGGGVARVSQEPDTFTFISGGLPANNPLHLLAPVYGKDADRVYGDFIVLNQANPATFKVLDPVGIAVDGERHVYFGTHLLDDTTWYPDTLQTTWPTYYYTAGIEHKDTNLRLFVAINGNPVVINLYSGDVRPLNVDVDLKSFSTVYSQDPAIYAKDWKHVYVWYNTETPVTIQGAEPTTFRAATKADVDAAAKRGLTVDAADIHSYYFHGRLVGPIQP